MRKKKSERIIAKGGTGRIRLFGVSGFNYADVTFNQNADINCSLVNVVPLTQQTVPNTSADETVEAANALKTAPKQQNPSDPQIWYEVQGRKVLESLITDLHSRGYNSLTIRENFCNPLSHRPIRMLSVCVICSTEPRCAKKEIFSSHRLN